MNNAGGDHSQAAIMDFARGRAFHYGLLELSLLVKLTFAFCIYSISDGQSYNKTGYSTKDTLSRLSQGWQQFEVYRQQGLGELLQPLLCLRWCPRATIFG